MRKWIKTIATGIFSRLGYAVIPNWQLDRDPMRRHLQQLFALLQTDCVIDVGANAGQYRDFLRNEVGYSGLIWSFEPTPDLAAELRRRSDLDRKWIVEQVALGRESGVAKFKAMAGSQFNSFRTPDNSRVPQLRAQNTVTQEIDVEVRDLDGLFPDFMRRHGVRSPYLKLDTQGFDLEVVAGASKTLTYIRGLQMEASVLPIYEDSPDYVKAIRAIEARNFELSGIFPNNEGHFPRLVEFDCHFVAKPYIPQRS